MRLLLFFAALLVSALLWPGQSSPLGVICHRPDLLNQAHWSALEQLGATCELLVIPTTTSPEQPFDFSQFEADLTASASHKLEVAASPVPHLGSVPWLPQTAADGSQNADRQNPYDPAFLAEWSRFHLALCERYGHDPRLKRIYVNPPSFYGETEYYLGSDWKNPVFFCYGPLARQRYAEWRQEWLKDSKDPSKLYLPKPYTRVGQGAQGDREWLELMRWRHDYLVKLMGDQLFLIGHRFDGETCVNESAGV